MTDEKRDPDGGYGDEPGLVPDEDLPEDLQPTDDNPLAKDPDPDADPAEKGTPPPADPA